MGIVRHEHLQLPYSAGLIYGCRVGFYIKSSPSLMQYAIREIFINRLHPLRAHRPQTQCFNCSDQKYLEALGIFLEDR
nr:MAG TPA: hypothetical protein [Caudoviricetes sp.]